jgi:enoyl-CoA hydratase/carnithine racemase
MSALVLTEDLGAVRVITLNRPEVRNAIDVPLRIELAERLEEAGAEDAVRAIVVTGAGGSFCSGGDISSMVRQSPALTRPRAQAAQRVVRAIWATPKPVLAAVEGAAFGAGAALALACDRVVAGESAIFSFTFTKVGLAGDMGVFASLPARVGAPRARQLLMLPRPIPAAEAVELGMADAVVPDDSVLHVALDDAQRLAAGPADALGVIKELFNGTPRHPAEILELEVSNQARLFDSDDFAEGVAAFAEKRAPRFGGR